jgi:hypothetical protein
LDVALNGAAEPSTFTAADEKLADELEPQAVNDEDEPW